MVIRTLDDLFVYKLQNIYYIETELSNELDMLAQASMDESVREIFQDHRLETQDQIMRLEEVFTMIGEDPVALQSHVIDAVMAETREAEIETTEEDLLDMYYIAVGMKTERIEINAYETLINMAKILDYDNEIIDSLRQNLREEKAALDELKSMSKGSIFERLINRLT